MKIIKSKLNFIIDTLMLIVMIPIIGIGFLIKYVLVPGFERNKLYGSDVELYYFGIDRHQWGTIHLYLGFVLLFLLLLHIVFHWKQIISLFKTIVFSRVRRIILSSLLVIFIIVFGILPLFITPEAKERVTHNAHYHKEGKGYHSEDLQHKNKVVVQPEEKITPTKENKKKDKNNGHSDIEIFGYMTINEVSAKYNIPAADLASHLHLPVGNNNIKLGILKKQYRFQLSELRDYIDSKTNKK